MEQREKKGCGSIKHGVSVVFLVVVRVFLHYYIDIERRSVSENTVTQSHLHSEVFSSMAKNQSRNRRQEFTQCYTGTSCSGAPVTAASARGCCVDTENGLSFSSSVGCTPCVGELLT